MYLAAGHSADGCILLSIAIFVYKKKTLNKNILIPLHTYLLRDSAVFMRQYEIHS